MVQKGWGSVNLRHSFTRHLPRIQLLWTRRERWIITNRGMILTLIIHWLEPPLFLPWCSEAKLAIWSERLAKGQYQKNNSPAVRLEPAILVNFLKCISNFQAFYQLAPMPNTNNRNWVTEILISSHYWVFPSTPQLLTYGYTLQFTPQSTLYRFESATEWELMSMIDSESVSDSLTESLRVKQLNSMVINWLSESLTTQWVTEWSFTQWVTDATVVWKNQKVPWINGMQ